MISVGNLCVGGSGKTPVVAHIAHLLLERGERPAVLSRGYKRARPVRGVTVVSDRSHVMADIGSAGDEPLMLARALPGVAVLVGPDRYRSGRLAEDQLGVTVHVLDDGFQHVMLQRDVDLLLLDASDLTDRVLPAGRLREPLRNAAAADAVLMTGGDLASADAVARRLGIADAFLVTRTIHQPRPLASHTVVVDRTAGVLACAGIAQPQRFFDDLSSSGWRLVETLRFVDHHPYRQSDVARIVARARASGASLVLTTEKDAVRLEGLDLAGIAFAAVPLTSTIEPSDRFSDWLMARVRRPR